MNNIEKLAIEQGLRKYAGPHNEYIVNLNEIEAFAKALQSSEPVARYVVDVLGYTLIKFQDVNLRNGDLLYTHPPASVPLEKYNKLLDRIRVALYQDLRDIKPYLRQAIAEAEGKEG